MTSSKIRVPAEWEPQDCTWLCWPHHQEHWGERLTSIRDVVQHLVETICRFQPVRLLINDAQTDLPSSLFEGKFDCEVVVVPHDDLWIRDYGPFFAVAEDHLEVRQFRFNAWGQKFPPWERDEKVSHVLSGRMGWPLFSSPWIVEGGALDFNGSGVAMTTRSCLVSEFRNPGASEQRMCEVIQKHLNLDALIVLPEGLHGDHTDGHIDNVARFIAEDVVVMAEPKTGDENEKILQKAYRQLKEWRHPIHKTPLKIKFLPSLRPICKQNDIFPLSFLNFIFLNSALLYPSYGESSENKVKDALHTWFPEREILGIDCRLLIEEGGALHCMTRQQPSLERF